MLERGGWRSICIYREGCFLVSLCPRFIDHIQSYPSIKQIEYWWALCTTAWQGHWIMTAQLLWISLYASLPIQFPQPSHPARQICQTQQFDGSDSVIANRPNRHERGLYLAKSKNLISEKRLGGCVVVRRGGLLKRNVPLPVRRGDVSNPL